MLRLIRIGIALLWAVPAVSHAADDDRAPGNGRPLRIQFHHTDMIVTDDGLLAVHTWTKAEPGKRPGPPPKSDMPYYFRDGAHIRASIERKYVPGDGKYLTADYSTSPPRVILTERPSEDSRWKFVKVGNGRWTYKIKNESDRGMAAWLDMEDTGKRYSTVRTDSEYHVYKPILSFSDKTEFTVIDVRDDGGK